MITRQDLADAIEGMQEMLPYVHEYFRTKHGLDEYVRRAEAVLRADGESRDELADLRHVNQQLREKLQRHGLWDDPE